MINAIEYVNEQKNPMIIKEPPTKAQKKIQKEEPIKDPSTDTGIGLNFNRFIDNDVMVYSGSNYNPVTNKSNTKKRKTKNNEEEIIQAKPDGELNDFQSNEPYRNKYAETDAILKTAIAQIDMSLNEIQRDIAEVRSSRTIKKKYDYLSMLQGTTGNFIGNKIAAARELNNTISKCNDLELRRYKEITSANKANMDDDRAIMEMYNAYISTPMNTGLSPNGILGGNSLDATLLGGSGGNIVSANIGSSDTGFNDYISNMTPAQNAMFLDSNPNIKTVVVYNAGTGARYFDVIDTTTGQSIPNADVPAQFLMENITIDKNNNIARDTELNITYPLVVVGNEMVLNEY